MRNWKKIVVGALAVIGAFYLLMTILVSFIAEPECVLYPVRKEASPNGRFTVMLEHRECRSNRDITVELWVSEAGSSRRWGVFSSRASVEVGAGRYTRVEPSWAWLSDTALQITYPRSVVPTTGEGAYGNLKVVYVRSNDPPQ